MQVLSALSAKRLTMMPVGGDGVGNGFVEQPVENLKFTEGDRLIFFSCQLGDGLADIPVTVNDLVHGVSAPEQLLAMQGSRSGVFCRGSARGTQNSIVLRLRV